eukprot:scaffold13.g300.t1
MEDEQGPAPAPREIEFDLGNLAASDPAPLDAAAWAAQGTAAACHGLASRLLQALAGQLFALPSEAAPAGRLAALPPPALALPREKPLPKPRPPTKWELFAQRKGIQKRKRTGLLWDEGQQEWKRRHGYGRANDEAAVPVIEARPGDAVGGGRVGSGEDPFAQQRAAKKARVAKQDRAQLANLKAGAKAGGRGALPPTLRLAAALPEHGRGAPAKRKELKGELNLAARQVAVSTASAGKFDRKVAGEKAADRPQRGKRKKDLEAVADRGGGERARQAKAVDHILRRTADDVVDVSKAISRYERDAREERRREKNKGEFKGKVGKKAAPSRAGGGKGGKGGRPGGAKPGGGGKGGKPGGGGRGGKPGGGGRGGKPGGGGKGRPKVRASHPHNRCLTSLPAGTAVAQPLFGTSLSDGWPGATRLGDWSRAGYGGGYASGIPGPDATAPPTDVRSLGAVGDGVTDNWAVLQRAVDAAAAAQTPLTLQFPRGTFLLSSPLVIRGSGIVLRGAGVDLTVVYIPRSLGDWAPGTWTVDSKGERGGAVGRVTSSWAFGGAFIQFSGEPPVGERLAAALDAPRGATRVPVDDATRLAPGALVALQQYDPEAAPRAAAAGGGGPPRPALRPPPDSLRQTNPVAYYALLAAWESDDVDETLPPEEAAAMRAAGYAALAAAAGAAQAPPGKAGASAAPGTLTSWIYGDGMADSGQSSAQLNYTMRFSAVVTAVGDGWVELDRAVPLPVRASWRAALYAYRPTLQHSGIESMTITFKWDTYVGHLSGKGYNAINIMNAANCWARNLKLVNADVGILTSGADWSTIADVTVAATAPRGVGSVAGFSGHHALWVTRGQENLVQRCNIPLKWFHDLSIENYATLNVFSTIAGADINIDNHRSASFMNLFSSIALGAGTRPFDSSGLSTRGAHAGAYQTFWNLQRANGGAVPLPDCSFGPQLNFVGPYFGKACAGKQWRVEALGAGAPSDLYAAQLGWRLAALARNQAARRRPPP